MCWIAVKGPTMINTAPTASTADNTFTIGDPVCALTAATSGALSAGRVAPFAVTTTVTTIMSVAFNKVGRAMSAMTSAQTIQDVLVNLEIWA